MIDLDPKTLVVIKSIVMQHFPGITVKAFGSRVTGKAKAFSDLDLVLIDTQPIPAEKMNALKFAFSDSDLPIMVDVVDWQGISAEFREIIEKGCAPF